jgi:hypothetical protein
MLQLEILPLDTLFAIAFTNSNELYCQTSNKSLVKRQPKKLNFKMQFYFEGTSI